MPGAVRDTAPLRVYGEVVVSMMTAAERRAYHLTSDSERRAKRRELLAEIERFEQTAAVLDAQRCPSALLSLRDDLEAFTRGDDDLMGTPHHINLGPVFASIDRALQANGEPHARPR